MKRTVEVDGEEFEYTTINKYPWHELEDGKSFFVDCSLVNEFGFRTRVSAKAKQMGLKLKCVKHKELNALEVSVNTIKTKERTFEIYESSPRMKNEIFNDNIVDAFLQLTSGNSLSIGYELVALESLQYACSTFNKKYKKNLVILKHDEYSVFEVSNSNIEVDVLQRSDLMKEFEMFIKNRKA